MYLYACLNERAWVLEWISFVTSDIITNMICNNYNVPLKTSSTSHLGSSGAYSTSWMLSFDSFQICSMNSLQYPCNVTNCPTLTWWSFIMWHNYLYSSATSCLVWHVESIFQLHLIYQVMWINCFHSQTNICISKVPNVCCWIWVWPQGRGRIGCLYSGFELSIYLM